MPSLFDRIFFITVYFLVLVEAYAATAAFTINNVFLIANNFYVPITYNYYYIIIIAILLLVITIIISIVVVIFGVDFINPMQLCLSNSVVNSSF